MPAVQCIRPIPRQKGRKRPFQRQAAPVRHSPFHHRKHTMDWRYTPIFIPPIPGRRYLLCQPSLTGSSMTTEIKTDSMTWENPASPAYLFCYIRLPAAALPPNPTPMAAMAFPSPRQAPIQSAKPRSRPTPARLPWLLNRQAMLTPTAPAHGPPRSLPPKSNATRSLPGKISGMTQWMLPCPAPLK